MKKFFGLVRLFLYDFIRFYRFSGSLHVTEREQVLAHLVHAYHRVEKGLTMPRFRAGFGTSAIRMLMKWIRVFEERYGTEEPQLRHAVGVLKGYLDVHHRLDVPDSMRDMLGAIEEFCAARPYAEMIEQPTVSRADFFKFRNASFPEFAHSRHTLRHYAGVVEPERIQSAVRLAQSAPSACNRQPIRVYCLSSREKIEGMMAIQGGNRGFGTDCDKLLVVTADLHSGNWIAERNSLHFDAGLFTMNLCYALHYQEVAHCILNWSTTVATDKQAHALLGIPPHEEIEILIACGRPAESFKVPCSPRRPLEEIYRTLD